MMHTNGGNMDFMRAQVRQEDYSIKLPYVSFVYDGFPLVR